MCFKHYFLHSKTLAVSSSEINFKTFKKILDGQKFPLAFVDMNMLEENIQQILQRSGTTPIRIASKSIRCRHMLDYILKSNKQFQGIMSFSGSEAVFLSTNGFDDILVAYPVLHKKEIAEVCQEIKKGKYINLMTDTSEHIRLINEVGSECNVKVPISIDIDMSVDFPGLHFGVWRSSIRSVKNLKVLLEEIKKLEFVRLEGIMGYEAQIAGVTDNVPGKWLMNTIIRSLKKGSIGKIAKRRAEAVAMIREMDFELKIVNGGGTGSLEYTIKEEVITEVTVGSGDKGGGKPR